MGDFLGFTFGGIHSSALGITRVSGGDRYNEELHPEIKDRTAEVPGLDGEYYFGSNFGPRSFDIEIAFDGLTETQFRLLRTIFGTRQIKELIFDERPYKKYMAKLENPIELSFVAFDEPKYTWEKIQDSYNNYVQGISGDFEHKVYDGTTQRIYKGEGKITFVCHYPFAKSVYKVLPVSEEDSDWVISSGILSTDTYVQFDTFENGQIKVYNPGDMSTGFRLYCPFTAAAQPESEEVEPNEEEVEAAPSTYNITLAYTEGGSTDVTAVLQIQNLEPIGEDIGFIINTDTGLIVGVSAVGYDNNGNRRFTTSGNLYNRYVTSGHFFKLNPSISINDGANIQISGDISDIEIYYDYLYF